jgi:hypothetical protein
MAFNRISRGLLGAIVQNEEACERKYGYVVRNGPVLGGAGETLTFCTEAMRSFMAPGVLRGDDCQNGSRPAPLSPLVSNVFDV